MPEDDVDTPPPYGADGWHTLDSARFGWDDAPYEDSILADLLEVAKDQCLAFAPDVPVGGWVEDLSNPGYLRNSAATVPTRFRVAQLMQTRNLWNASKTDPSSGGIGGEGFVVRPFPMDWTVKNILRPKRGVPFVG